MAGLKRGVAALLLAVLAGCGSTPAQIDRYYRPAVAVPAAHAPLKVRFTVEPFEVHGLYSDRPLVYLDGSGAYQQSNHHSWIEPPSVMLGSGLLDAVRAAYGAESAFLPDARVAGDITIRPRLRRFERIPGAGMARAALSLEIVVTARGGRLIGSVEFDETAAAGTSIPDYVQTQAALLGKAYATLFAMLDEHAASLSAAN